MTRYVLRARGVAEASPEDLVEWIAPTMQRYLAGERRPPPARTEETEP